MITPAAVYKVFFVVTRNRAVIYFEGKSNIKYILEMPRILFGICTGVPGILDHSRKSIRTKLIMDERMQF